MKKKYAAPLIEVSLLKIVCMWTYKIQGYKFYCFCGLNLLFLKLKSSKVGFKSLDFSHREAISYIYTP